MKTYTVKEIADMLKIDPETVRRWIRQGKLQAEQASRKEGNVVSEQMLQNFFGQFPKYARTVTPMVATPVGITVTTASVLAGILAQQCIKNEKTKKAQISEAQVVNLLEEDIKSREKAIAQKEKAIKQLKRDIFLEKQYISETKNLLAQMMDVNK